MSFESRNESPRDMDTNHMWNCGNTTYHSPEATLDFDKRSEEETWKEMSAPLLLKDKARCRAWEEEVKNLLLFAGLFSAVVTSFVIESYKGLSQDPVVSNLSQIVVLLADSLNATLSSSGKQSQVGSSFNPGSSNIRLNIFLFLSLMVSLSTALVGIICLQWLREHLRVNDSLTPDTSFAMLYMRIDALEQWYVPAIFAALPVLLQLAVLLFFAGILELLLNAGHIQVMIPTGVVAALTISFLILTTILPTLQAFTLYHPQCRLSSKIPAPCPYKSPQSALFRFSAARFEVIFLIASYLFVALYRVTTRLLRFLNRSRRSLLGVKPAAREPTDTIAAGFDYMKPKVLQMLQQDDWHAVDVIWMSLRDNYFQSCCPESSWLYENRKKHEDFGGWYDITQGICGEIGNLGLYKVKAGFKSHTFTEYHCALFHIFSIPVGDDREKAAEMLGRYRYLATCLNLPSDADTLSQLSTLLSLPSTNTLEASTDILREETSLIILYAIRERLEELETPFPPLNTRLAEIYIRLAGQIFSKEYLDTCDFGLQEKIPTMFPPVDLYVMPDIFGAKDQPFTWRWAVTLDTFFKSLADIDMDIDMLKRTRPIHLFFQKYTYNFWRQFGYEISWHTAQDRTVQQVLSTLTFIEQKLLSGPADDMSPQSEIFFYSAIQHVQYFHELGIQHIDLDVAIESLLSFLRDLKPRVHRSKPTPARRLLNENCPTIASVQEVVTPASQTPGNGDPADNGSTKIDIEVRNSEEDEYGADTSAQDSRQDLVRRPPSFSEHWLKHALYPNITGERRPPSSGSDVGSDAKLSTDLVRSYYDY